MDLEELVGPLGTAFGGVVCFVLAVLVGRGNLGLVNGLDAERVVDRNGLARRLALQIGALGACLLGAAGGFAWAGADKERAAAVALAVVVTVNLIVIALILTIARARREYRALPTDRDGRRSR